MLCHVRWVYITYGIAFNTKQNLDIKKQPVEIGLKAQVLRRSWHENRMQNEKKTEQENFCGLRWNTRWELRGG